MPFEPFRQLVQKFSFALPASSPPGEPVDDGVSRAVEPAKPEEVESNKRTDQIGRHNSNVLYPFISYFHTINLYISQSKVYISSSGADLGIFVCQSKMTSHFCNDRFHFIFRGGWVLGDAPPQNFLKRSCILRALLSKILKY